MIKLKNILSEQDTTISEKEWSKVEKVITRGMDNVFDKDFLAGIFYSIFGVNDMLFLIAFIYIYSRIK